MTDRRKGFFEVLRGPGARDTSSPSPVDRASFWPYLSEVTGLLNACTHDFDRTVGLIIDEAIALTGSERGCLVLFNEDRTPRIAVARRNDRQGLTPRDFLLSRTIIQRVIETGEPIYVENILESPELRDAESVMALQLLSAMCVPLAIPDTSNDRAVGADLALPSTNGIIGAVYVDSSHATRIFSGEHLEMFRVLANHATTAILNAMLFRQYLEKERLAQAMAIAQLIQERLLPHHAPAIEGFDVAGRCTFCEATGGDHYDFFPLEDGRLGFAVSDVSGHGVGSALLMASTRGLLRAFARTLDDPRRIVTLANELLVPDTDLATYVTLFLGTLDPRTRTLAYVNAGHEPAILRRAAGGRIQTLPATGVALGLSIQESWPEAVSVPLEAGDVVLITTDGLREARNPEGTPFGRTRMGETLGAVADRPAADIIERVYEDLGLHCGEEPVADDVTVVCVKAV